MIILGIVYYRAYNIRLEEKRPCELVSNLRIRLPRIFCDFHVILRQASLLHFLRWSFFPKVNGTAVGKHPCGLLTSLWGLPSKKRTPLLTGGRPRNAALFTEAAANVEEHFPRDFAARLQGSSPINAIGSLFHWIFPDCEVLLLLPVFQP